MLQAVFRLPAVVTNAGDPSNHSVFHFQYSIQKNHMRYSTLHCKTGFVLDASALLLARVSVLSTVKVGQATL